ncbi:MAG: type IV toxin-antitoxin system AbiEi family antitoxin domain-containing protein [Lachnospiraceae bacterium]|nr:type IV toxin-antitoxin system AbiEi family antitoxin domain-containing protein [Lachnospiraceae bacterium]
MKVNKKEIIEAKILQNQGIIQIADIVAEGISKQYAIKYLQERNYERIAKGIYLAQDAWQDELYIISLQYKKIVYSHNTALYLLGLSEREPICFTVTVPRGYKVDYRGNGLLKRVTVVEERYSLGIDTATTPYGHIVPCYNAERTLCDIFRTDTEIQEKQVAVKEYLNGKKNLPRLMEYAKILHIEKKIKQYMEVLL